MHNNERNPRIASSFGTGQLIKCALDQGFKILSFVLEVSATNDAGVGMLRALGLRLVDELGQDVQKSIEGLFDVKRLQFLELESSLSRVKDFNCM